VARDTAGLRAQWRCDARTQATCSHRARWSIQNLQQEVGKGLYLLMAISGLVLLHNLDLPFGGEIAHPLQAPGTFLAS